MRKVVLVRLTLRCMVYLDLRYTLFGIVVLDLSRDADTRVHLNVKVRDLRDIPEFT
jgi:hypothetical protein